MGSIEEDSPAQPAVMPSPTSARPNGPKVPAAILVIGMAGSGKTTFMQRLNSKIHMDKKKPYVVNLDPAVSQLPFGANIDIRDTVNYKEVMKQYTLGPNGAILTALNLFTTKFDQVLELLAKRASKLDYVLFDTPGQIEIFTWSASGAIITDTVAASYPSCIAYVIDTPRSTAPVTFMSNMLYAVSILYKTRLPFILVFNKTDVVSHEFAIEWMTDFEAFQASVREDSSYMGTLVNSMCLVLEEFYKSLKVVGVSAVTGEGMDDFMNAVDDAVDEYYRDYRPEVDAMIEEKRANARKEKEANLEKLMNDMELSENDSGGDVIDINKRKVGFADEEEEEVLKKDEAELLAFQEFKEHEEERSFARFVGKR
ncbi:hypothetical protein HDU67_004469 [Dinochytrium kinnereticum]|nr:hypothetical protein HDU67_004469 [Dinochytrium kinnereticum]